MSDLIEACDNVDIDRVKSLIASRADVNVQDYKGDTPLHIACVKCNVELAMLLLDNGAKMDVLNNEGLMPYNASNNADIKKLLESKEGYRMKMARMLNATLARIVKQGGKMRNQRKTHKKRKPRTHKKKIQRHRNKSKSQRRQR